MQQLDVRFAFFLLPLIYVLIPFILTGNFIILGGVTIITFLIGMILFIIVSNLNVGGSAEAIATGGSAQIGLTGEGGYSLQVVFIGGLFYLGASLATIFSPIFDMLIIVVNGIIGLFAWIVGADVTALQVGMVDNLGLSSASNLSQVYPRSIMVQGISVFLVLDVLFASMFILSLYFMISSRGG